MNEEPISIALNISRDSVLSRLIRKYLNTFEIGVDFISIGKDNITIEGFNPNQKEEIIKLIKELIKYGDKPEKKIIQESY